MDYTPLEDGRWAMAAVDGQHAEDRLLAILHGDAVDPYNNDSYTYPLDDPFALAKASDGTIDPRRMQHGYGSGGYNQQPLSGITSPNAFSAGLSSPSSVDDNSLYSASVTGSHHGSGAFPFPPYGFQQAHPILFSPGMYPHPASVAGSSLASGSVKAPSPASSDPPPRPNKRARQETEDVHEVEPPAQQRKIAKACQHCKKIKMKCDFQPGSRRCERCIKKDFTDCRVDERRKPSGPNVRERLLHNMRAKDQLIAGLLKHIFDPSAQTPLGIMPNRIDAGSLTRTIYPPSPEDTDSDAPGTVPGLAQQRASAGTLLSLVAQANSSIRATPAWKLEVTSSDESDDESETDSDPAAEQREQRDLARATMQALPAEHYPLGLISRLSLQESTPTPLEQAITDLQPTDDHTALLDTVVKSEDGGASEVPNKDVKAAAGANLAPVNFGLENPRYFHPGPAANLPLRQIIIDKQLSIEILDFGIVSLAEVEELFDIFYRTINPALSILDEALHTASSVRKRCPFLFTVVCASSARYYTKKPQLYPLLVHFAKKAAASALIDGWKSVEMCQAYIILGDYAPPARRWEEDRSYLYKGLAIRIAMDLNLHQPSRTKPRDERHARELRNRTRVWLICHNIDRSASTQFGKAATLPADDPVVRASKDWYLEPFAHPFDIHLCGYVALLRIMTQFHEIVRERGATTMNKNIDYLAVTRLFDEQLTTFRIEWSERFDKHGDKTDRGVALRISLLPILVNYCKLIMYSFGFQYAFEKGLARGDPFFLRCWNAATSVVRGMADLGPSFLRNTAECHNVFGAFASGFLFKLLRPEFSAMVDSEQRQSILNLVKRFADALEASAIDETHSPRLYARFLHGLVRKHSGLPPIAPATVQPGNPGPGDGSNPASQGSSTSKEETQPRNGKKRSPGRGAGGSGAKRAGGNANSASDKAGPKVATADSWPSTSGSTDSNNWPPQTQLPTPVEPTSFNPLAQFPSQASYGSGASTSTQQQPATWNFYPADPNAAYGASLGVSGMGMEVDDPDQMLLPLRALTNPAFGEHMLLPGWMQPQPQMQTAIQTNNTMSGNTGIMTSPTDIGMSLEELNAAIFGVGQSHAFPTQPAQPLQQHTHHFSGQQPSW